MKISKNYHGMCECHENTHEFFEAKIQLWLTKEKSMEILWFRHVAYIIGFMYYL